MKLLTLLRKAAPAAFFSLLTPLSLADDWRQQHHDAQRTSFNAKETELGPANVGRLVPVWSRQQGYYLSGHIHTPDGAAVFCDGSRVAFRRAATGEKLGFSAEMPGACLSPAMGGGKVYVTNKDVNEDLDDSLTAVDAKTGAIDWVVNIPGIALGEATYDEARLYVSDAYDYISAFWAATGSMFWRTHVGNSIGLLAVADGRVFATLRDTSENRNSVVALDKAKGGLLWRHRILDRDISPDVLAARGLVVTTSYADNRGAPNVKVHVLDAATGAERWTYKIRPESSYWVSGVASGDGLLVALTGNVLQGFDLLTGQVKWRQTVTALTPEMVLANGVVYLTEYDHTVDKYFLATLDAATGERIVQEQPYPLVAQPGSLAVVDGQLLMRISGRNAPNLIAFGLLQR